MKSSNIKKQKVLITGVAGLIGSNLADFIINNTKEYEVYGIDDLTGGYYENVNKEVNFTHCNILDSKFNDTFAAIKPDYVFHLAAYAAEGLSPFIRQYNYKNNLVCTAGVVNQCIKHNVKRLVFTSSLAVYGDNSQPYQEDMIPNPMDPYGVAKYACELDIKIAGQQHGLDWCIIRPHNVYGRKQNIWDRYRNVLGIWMYQHLKGEKITIYGDGLQTRAFSNISDVNAPLFRSCHDPKASKQIINLGGIKEYSINESSDILISVMGGGVKEYLEKRHEVKYSYPTFQKSIDLLGFNHTIDLEMGLRDMWEWAKNQDEKPRFSWSSYELDKGIYPYWV